MYQDKNLQHPKIEKVSFFSNFPGLNTPLNEALLVEVESEDAAGPMNETFVISLLL